LTENMDNRLLWVAALLAVHVSIYQKFEAGLIINGKNFGAYKRLEVIFVGKICARA